MEYAKFIKSHPLPELTDEQKQTIISHRNINARYTVANVYSAQVIDDILQIIVCGTDSKGKPLIIYRHLFDGSSYCTQRIEDNRKLDGMICAYINGGYWGYSSHSFSPADDLTIKTYLNCVDVAEKHPIHPIHLLQRAEDKISKQKLAVKHKKIIDITAARMAGIGDVPQEFTDWVDNCLLSSFRYFFYRYQSGNKQTGYCSHCTTVFTAEKIRHGSTIICPNCGSVLTAKSLGKTTKYAIKDSIKAIYLQVVDDTAVVERYFSVNQTISGHQLGVENFSVVRNIYEENRIFLGTVALDYIKDANGDYSYYYGIAYDEETHFRWCGDKRSYYNYGKGYIYPGTINDILNLTTYKKLHNIDGAAIVSAIPTNCREFVRQMSKDNPIEGLIKQGYLKLAIEVWNENEYHTDLIVCKSRSPSVALGIDKPALAALGPGATGDQIILYRILKSLCPAITLDVYRRYTALSMEKVIWTLKSVLTNKHINAVRFVGYMEKQVALLKRKGNAVLNVYYDYLSMANELRLPMTDSVIYPINVQKEHDTLMKIKVNKQYEKQNKKLAERGKLLSQLNYDDGKLCIVAFTAADDFLNESSVLSHCVKTYIDRCSKGETNIYGIRRSDTPDIPYFTLTLNNDGKVVQNLGKNNCNPPTEVKKFVEKWVNKMIKPNIESVRNMLHGKKERIKVTA